MPLLIDTYNVLHVTGVLPPDIAGIEVAELLDLIRVSRYRGEECCLVCDGSPGPQAPVGRSGRRQVVYAGPGQTADDLIAQMIVRSSAPRRLTVVSSDNNVKRAARKRRCRTLDADSFLEQLAADNAKAGRTTRMPDTRPHAPLSPRQVDEWIRIFGLHEGDGGR